MPRRTRRNDDNSPDLQTGQTRHPKTPRSRGVVAGYRCRRDCCGLGSPPVHRCTAWTDPRPFGLGSGGRSAGLPTPHGRKVEWNSSAPGVATAEGDMANYIALLRAMNVGGRNRCRWRLCATCCRFRLDDPRTLLQSGTSLQGARDRAAALESRLEAGGRKRVSVSTTDFMVRSAADWHALSRRTRFRDTRRASPATCSSWRLNDRADRQM